MKNQVKNVVAFPIGNNDFNTFFCYLTGDLTLSQHASSAKRRLPTLDVCFQITGKGDFTEEDFDIIFNMDMPVNETDVITNARNSEGLISSRTILKNHPWVEDAEEEQEQIEKEKQQAMESFGAGLFDGSLAAGRRSAEPQDPDAQGELNAAG